MQIALMVKLEMGEGGEKEAHKIRFAFFVREICDVERREEAVCVCV